MAVPLNPLKVDSCYCYACGEPMRVVMDRLANGRITGVVYYCDKCKYGVRGSLAHITGESVPWALAAPVSRLDGVVPASKPAPRLPVVPTLAKAETEGEKKETVTP